MYARIVSDLRRAAVPLQELRGPGAVAVTLAAGRVVALAFSQDEPNLLWSHPDLGDAARVKDNQLVGGIGGDRLWFAPEVQYHWLGEPDWRGLGNYQVPADTDPGRYRFVDSGPGVVGLTAEGTLAVRADGRSVDFRVERRIRLTPPPLPPDDPVLREARYVGVEFTHELALAESTRAGQIDLWQLLQTPVGSVLIVPLRPGHARPVLSYGLPGNWRLDSNCLLWRIQGQGNAKIGLAAAALTGRAAILRGLPGGQWCLMVRQFPLDTAARYGDHPWGVPREDQVVQAWDGLGFGEIEFHSPVLDAARGPRSLAQTDQLWAFGGSARTIAALADAVLQVDIRGIL